MSAGAAPAEAPAGSRRLNLAGSLRWARWAALLAVAFTVYFAADRYMDLPPSGDQPHYELEAYSLWLDGDRDLRNDYSDPSRTSQLFGPAVPDLHAHRYTKSPALYSVHNVGLPLLLVPGAALGRHTTYWFHVELVLIAALAALVLLSILEELRLARPVWTYLVWPAIAFSAPIVVFAGQAFPELPGALFALLAIRALVSRPLRRRHVVLGSIAASLIPWLHVRFTLLAVMLVAALAVRAVAAEPGAPTGLRSAFRRERLSTTLTRIAWAVVPLLLSLGAMAIEFQRWYGSPLLNPQYQGRQPA